MSFCPTYVMSHEHSCQLKTYGAGTAITLNFNVTKLLELSDKPVQDLRHESFDCVESILVHSQTASSGQQQGQG